jgi:hypothetical protein
VSEREFVLCALSFIGGGSLGMMLTAWFARREWLRLREALSAAFEDDADE